jgi:toxin ParE1/3/4
VSYSLIVTPEAERDLEEIVIWYEEQKFGLGSRLIDLVEGKLESITANPLKYQVRYKEVRMTFILPFPVGIHFVVRNAIIHVIAFISTHKELKI